MTGLREFGAVWQFEEQEFPGAEFSVASGHDRVMHAGLLQRGGHIETTGPKAKTFQVKVPLYNGLRGWRGVVFPDLYVRLVRLLETTPYGTLYHPTRGALSVHVDDIKEAGDPKNDGGVTLDLTFTEQDGSAGEFALGPITTPRAAIEAAEAQALAAAVDRPGLLAQLSALYDTVADAMSYADEALRTYAEVAATLESAANQVEALLDDPAVMVSDLLPMRSALYTTMAAVQRVKEEFAADAGTFTTTQDASVSEIASYPEVYGDASRAADLCKANRIADPTLVPAGTTLVVIP